MHTTIFVLLVTILTSCSHTNNFDQAGSFYSRQIPPASNKSQIAKGEHGMVASAHPLASEAGIEILKLGGNAADAAVAVSFAISVLRPQSTGIGGGGFLLHYSRKQDEIEAYDFRETAPGAAHRDMYLSPAGQPKDFIYQGKTIENASVNGHLAIATPGLVQGLWEVHKKHGSLPWNRLLEPAIRLARDGFPVYPSLSKAIEHRKEVLENFEASRALFLPANKPLAPGQLLIQLDLYKSLSAIAKEGAEVFYHGWIAEKIIDEIKRGRGILSTNDLRSYKVKNRQAIKSSFKDITLFSMPPPSSGGVHIAQMLNILENSQIDRSKHLSAKYVNILTETMRRAYADRAKYLGDSDFVNIPVKGIISKEYAKELGSDLPLGQAGDSSKIGHGNPVPYESPSTTHFSIVDSEGNGVSSTQTINYSFGSGVVAAGTGIVLNDEMDDFSKKPGTPNAYGLVGSEANSIAANKRMLSSMSPSLIFENNELVGILGSPGGSRIINATLQAILHRFLFKMSPKDSIHASRIHHQWLPDLIFIESENSLNKQTQLQLKEMGYKLNISSFPIGDVQAIFKEGNTWWGVSDIRSDGIPLGY